MYYSYEEMSKTQTEDVLMCVCARMCKVAMHLESSQRKIAFVTIIIIATWISKMHVSILFLYFHGSDVRGVVHI